MAEEHETRDDEVHKPSNDAERSAAKCGVLRYVSEDGLTFHFQSTRNVRKYHTVDLSAWDCSGACSCENFDMRLRKLLESGVIRPHAESAKCKHIKRAEKILCYWTKKNLVAQINTNTRTRK